VIFCEDREFSVRRTVFPLLHSGIR
jgi:hypothetical protein